MYHALLLKALNDFFWLIWPGRDDVERPISRKRHLRIHRTPMNLFGFTRLRSTCTKAYRLAGFQHRWLAYGTP